MFAALQRIWKARPHLHRARVRCQRFSAFRTDSLCPHVMTARIMVKHHWWRAIFAKPAISPARHGGDDTEEVCPFGSQHVFIPTWIGLVEIAFHQSPVDQTIKAFSQRVTRNSQTRLKIVKSANAVERLSKDEYRPGIAQNIHRASDPAGPMGEAFHHLLRITLQSNPPSGDSYVTPHFAKYPAGSCSVSTNMITMSSSQANSIDRRTGDGRGATQPQHRPDMDENSAAVGGIHSGADPPPQRYWKKPRLHKVVPRCFLVRRSFE